MKISGWAPYWQLDTALTNIEQNKNIFGDILLFSWECHANSTVTSQFYDPIPINRLKATGLPYWATYTSVMNGTQAADLFDDSYKSQVLIKNMLNIAKNIGATGLDLDFESINFGHSGDSLTRIRSGYPKFLKLLKSLSGTLLVSATIPARVSDIDPDWKTYDFAPIGAAVDLVRIMSYDYHTGSDTIGPVSPIEWYEKVQSYAKTRIPAIKIHMGIPAYGYEWPSGKTVNAKNADALAKSHGTTVSYNNTYKEGTFTYNDSTVWVATPLSMAARVASSKAAGVAGVAIWSIGDEPASAWPAMKISLNSQSANVMPPVLKPSVSLSKLKYSAINDPKLSQGKTTNPFDVKIVEAALVKEGLLAAQWVDGAYGTKTIDAYRQWQTKLGYTGTDADGIPGTTSLTKLGQKYGFVVVS